MLLVAGQWLYVVLRRREPATTWLLLAVPTLAFLPWLAYAVPRLVGYVGAKQAIEGYAALDPATFVYRYLTAFATGQRAPGQPVAVWLLGAVGLLALAGIGLVHTWRAGLGALAACYLGVALAGGWLVNLLFPFTPPYFERVLLYAAVPVYLLAAAGLRAWLNGRGPRWRPALAAVLAAAPLAGLAYFYTTPRYPERDYRPLFATIRRFGSEHDSVLCVHPWQYGYALAYLPPRLRHLALVPVTDWEDSDRRSAELGGLLRRGGRLWFPSHQSLGRILESEIETDLERLGYRAYSGWYGEETLLLAYASGEATSRGSRGAFAGGPTLLESSLSPRSEIGGAVQIGLRWQEPLPTGLTISLRLVGGGVTWADQVVALDAPAQRLALLVPWGTPATALDVVLVVSRDGVELLPEAARPSQRLARTGYGGDWRGARRRPEPRRPGPAEPGRPYRRWPGAGGSLAAGDHRTPGSRPGGRALVVRHRAAGEGVHRLRTGA